MKNYENHWAKHMWRPMMAYVYALICIMDFVVMPVCFEYVKSRDRLDTIVAQIEKINNVDVQLALAKRADYAGGRSWEPITMKDGGFFHLSYGALLTGAAIVRGKSKDQSEVDKQV